MTIAAGTSFAAWTIVSTDPTGKRATCRCVCGRMQIIAIEALRNGSTTSCGCQPLAPNQLRQFRAEAVQRQRQRERDWQPGGRS
jgi:hypothetical protein